MSEKRKTGTREWAEINKNFMKGCKHNCRYCYARANAKRFGQIEKNEDWENVQILPHKLNERPRKYNGRIMFPTTHDICPEFIQETIGYLEGLLGMGNEILIVSKPHSECIRRICEVFGKYKSKIVFRFTIGSMHDDVLKFWEKGAPGFQERLDSLKIAYEAGFTTSVSCEPYLDTDIEQLVEKIYPYVNDTIWIGKMNRIKQRVNMTGWTEQDYAYLRKVTDAQSDGAIWILYDRFKNDKKIKWKDSIKQVVGLPEDEVVG